ncbi:MAG: TetR/AcrR family transcriptional regulator [Anaerolineaceae bacterium]|nr:TetR/AcrR family transcriptional regulator [Anaerolineaceae bacterium]
MDKTPLSRHQRRRLRTREQIKQAGVKLLLEVGYDAISIQHITDEADLGRGTFYLHFKDKEDLVWSIIKDGIDVTDQEAQQHLDQAPPANPEFFGYLNMFRHAEQNKDLYRVMLGSQGSAILTAQVHAYLADELCRDMRTHPIYQDFDIPHDVLSQIVTGATIRLIIWWLENPNTYSARQMAEMLFECIHHRKIQ